MGTLKLYLDTHISRAVASQLRKRNVVVFRCEELGLADVSDEVHLETATELEAALVTHDADFFLLNAAWEKSGRHHSGIFFLNHGLQGDIGRIVSQLMIYVELIESGAGTLEADIHDRVTFIS